MKPKIPVNTLLDFASGRLSPEEGLKILDQLEDNPEASAMLDKTIELVEFDSGMDSRELEETTRRPRAARRSVFAEKIPAAFRWILRSPRRYIGLSVGVALVALWVLGSPHFSERRLAEAAIPSDEELHLLARGAEGGEVDLAAHLMAEQRIDDAIRVLDWYLAAFPTSEGAARAHFLSGLAHLKRSKEKLLGWFIGIDRGEVLTAEGEFMSTLMLSRSPDLSSEAKWYLARAQVLREPGGPGSVYLNMLEKEGGAHSGEAARLKDLVKDLK